MVRFISILIVTLGALLHDLDAAGLDMKGPAPLTVELRGKQKPLEVYLVRDAKTMGI